MTSIVDAPPAAATPSGDGHDLVEAIHQRIVNEHARFCPTVNGQEIYSPFALALLVAEIVNEQIAAAVPDLVRELGTADGEVRRLVNLLVAALDERDGLRAANDLLRAELSGREPVI